MTTLQWINAVIVAIGIPSLIGACIYVGRKFNAVENLEKFITSDLKPELSAFRDHAAEARVRLSVVETKLDGFAKTNSPLSLTPQGEKAVKASGLKQYIDSNQELLIAAATKNGKLTNPYDIQQSTAIFFDAYTFPEDVEEKLKDYAFNNGISLDVLLRVGALYLRDICLEAIR